MAFWGAPIADPDHAYNACKTALQMQEEIDKLRPELEKLGFSNFFVRVGLNSGDVTVGNMGSDSRFDYTVLGDNVNLSSRLEGLNKEYGTKILIGEGTYELVKDKISARLIDVVAVKGKKPELKCTNYKGLENPPINCRCEERSDVAIWLFKSIINLPKGHFKTAEKMFQEFLKLYPGDGPSKIFVLRCRKFMLEEPENWDGIYRSVSK